MAQPVGVELMREAIGHGVRMSVLTNAADATDEPMVHFAYARYRHAMLRAGVQMHELGGHLVAQSNDLGSFRSLAGRLPAKVALVDRRHVMVGSSCIWRPQACWSTRPTRFARRAGRSSTRALRSSMRST